MNSDTVNTASPPLNQLARPESFALPHVHTDGDAPAGGPPRCTVGLLTWNAGEDALACVRSMLAQTERPLEMIWVDNASTDGTPERLKSAIPELGSPTINTQNVGFCAGHDQAIAACRTQYYLALNQDIILAPDYVEKLCDWMDEAPELALASGLILWTHGEPLASVVNKAGGTATQEGAPAIYSAGLVYPRVRFPFELAMGQPMSTDFTGRRFVSGVTGAAMLLRVADCRRASLPETEIFPTDFFAYGEEVDLALRLARARLRCGIEGAAIAWHRGQGSGGLRRRAIRAKYLANHWMLTVRHESLRALLREAPYVLRGELQYWLPRYLGNPRALWMALIDFSRRWRKGRRFYHEFENRFGPTQNRLQQTRREALKALKQADK